MVSRSTRSRSTTIIVTIALSWLVSCACGTPLPGPLQLPHLQVVPTVSPLAGKLLDSEAAGDEGQCARDTTTVEAAASNRTLWAVRMLDASAHVPSGVFHGSRYQLGNFEGCMSAAETSPVGARYCLVSLSYNKHTAPAPATSAAPGRTSARRTPWELVGDLSPHQDAAEIMSGVGMADGGLPLGDLRAALCVPRACRPAVLQAAGTRWTAFDWRRHLRALGKADPPVSGMDLAPVSGMRFLTALYLVTVHRGLHSGRAAISNYEYYTASARSRPSLALLYRGSLAVDTFFFVAGLMLAVAPGRVSLGTAFAARATRVMSIYVIVLLFFVTALPEMTTGPLWTEVAQPMSDSCKSYWWANLLLVGNYVNGGTQDTTGCMGHSWSLYVDMHMFVVGVLLLRWLPAGLSGLAVLAGLSALSPLPLFLGTWLGDWPATVTWSLRTIQGMHGVQHIHDAYMPTHMRTPPYFVGLLAGRGLLELKARGFRPGRGATLVCTALGLAAMLAVMCGSAPFAAPDADFSAASKALYAAGAPLAWSLALAVVVVVTVLGERTLVHSLLSWQPLVTLSRLTFAVYIVSYPMQALFMAAKQDSVYLTPFNVIRDSLSDLVLSFAISFWLTIVAEAPARELTNKFLFGNRNATPKAKKAESEKED
ncbi:nose resistant to fluoxetine protein 6-like [Thrips palmi]|uniref:Nose resistant to fluoxetine protein 6-like n=1 Tax=Thrips palmi TaxID=161013 RepID=A0A6P9A5J9_THRPL|nr:nose resistant to fluoxetine protein 6-like [Thrips palmi]